MGHRRSDGLAVEDDTRLAAWRACEKGQETGAAAGRFGAADARVCWGVNPGDWTASVEWSTRHEWEQMRAALHVPSSASWCSKETTTVHAV